MKGFFITNRSSGSIPVAETISQATLPKKVKRNKEEVKFVVDWLKQLIKKEKDPECKRHLATAGIALNNLLIK